MHLPHTLKKKKKKKKKRKIYRSFLLFYTDNKGIYMQSAFGLLFSGEGGILLFNFFFLLYIYSKLT